MRKVLLFVAILYSIWNFDAHSANAVREPSHATSRKPTTEQAQAHHAPSSIVTPTVHSSLPTQQSPLQSSRTEYAGRTQSSPPATEYDEDSNNTLLLSDTGREKDNAQFNYTNLVTGILMALSLLVLVAGALVYARKKDAEDKDNLMNH